MFGILGEDASDFNTLKVIVKRLLNDESVTIRGRGYSGCGELLRKGARELQALAGLGMEKFVVCYDCDGADPAPKRDEILKQVVRPSGLKKKCCAVVPVQEMEAWILADIEAVSNVFSSWRPTPIRNPEAIPSPKEYLESLSRASNNKPRYSHATHNERVARFLRLEIVEAKCPSFGPLKEFFCPKKASQN